LERRLHDVKGRFILSLDDHPEVRKLFVKWHIEVDPIGWAKKRLSLDGEAG
jgi:hypothetical protein